MNITHKIEAVNGVEQIVLYVDYPDDYEFGLDFDALKRNVENVTDKIREYAFKNINKVTNETALLVLNGVIIGTLMVSGIVEPKALNAQSPTTQIESTITQEEQQDLKVLEQTEANNLDTRETESEDVASTEAIQNDENASNVNIATSAPVTNKKSTVPTTPKNSTQPSTPTNPTQPSTPQGQTVNLKLSTGQTIKIGLEDYVVGVVSAEMPVSFNIEALKAQSVAARTYALKRISAGQTLSATTSDQVYKTESQLKQMWGNSFTTYYNKVKSAVNATSGKSIKSNGSYIDALYFSTSNGKTEDSVNVWGNSFSYLKSVDSPWDVGVSNFKSDKSIPMSTISSKMGVKITSASQIVINSKTIGNRVKSVSFAGKTFTGVQVRTLLGLRAADFTVRQDGSNIIFTTKGYGHGVGMSQYGANGMANAGYSYVQILKHYYTGVTIQ